MGRRKQHCPKKATDGESDDLQAPIPSEEQPYPNSTNVDIAMAKWIQLQAQLALRLQQQQSDNLDENNKTHQGCSSSSIPSSSTCTTPLDFSLKSSPSHSSLASLASLMMESSPSSSSAAATAAAGMTALHKMTQLASSQRSHGVSPNRFQSSLPMLSLPYKPLPWQSSWLMMGRPPPPPTTSSMHQPPLPPSPAILRSLGVTEKNLDSIQPDLFRCIWCRQGFATMTKLGAHLKEANHGCNQKDTLASSAKKGSSQSGSTKSESKPGSSTTTTAPRKLVRGQDVWLGKGEEQTRQILKCMWCGQSFRSLADLTTHMSETKHYTKVIPQEQLSTWRAQHQQQQRTSSHSPAHSSSTPSPRPTSSLDSCIKTEKTSYKVSKKTPAGVAVDLTSIGIGIGGEKPRKKAIPVRKLLEMERQGAESMSTVNNENDLSDANRMLDVTSAACPPSSSILGSLERLVESSFKPNSSLEVVTAAAAAAHQVLLAKRASAALGSVFEEAAAEEEDNSAPEVKRRRGRRSTEASSEDSTPADKSSMVINIAQTPSRHQQLPSVVTSNNLVSSTTELKFLKYSELAKELSSGR